MLNCLKDVGRSHLQYFPQYQICWKWMKSVSDMSLISKDWISEEKKWNDAELGDQSRDEEAGMCVTHNWGRDRSGRLDACCSWECLLSPHLSATSYLNTATKHSPLSTWHSNTMLASLTPSGPCCHFNYITYHYFPELFLSSTLVSLLFSK